MQKPNEPLTRRLFVRAVNKIGEVFASHDMRIEEVYSQMCMLQVSHTALCGLLFEKGILTEEEYTSRVQALVAELTSEPETPPSESNQENTTSSE